MTKNKKFIIYKNLDILIHVWSVYKYFMWINFMDSYV